MNPYSAENDVIDCPIDATLITSRLYQGSLPPPGGIVRRCRFTMLVLCASEYQPPADLYPGVKVVHAPNDDTGLPPSKAQWRDAVDAARKATIEIRDGGKVLCTCMAGRNRSGLVSALTLHYLLGISGSEAAMIVRHERRNALTNDAFIRVLARVRRRGA